MIEQSNLLFGIIIPILFTASLSGALYFEHKRSSRCTVFRLPLVVMDLAIFSFTCAVSIYFGLAHNPSLNLVVLFLTIYLFAYRYNKWEYLPSSNR